VADQQTRLDSVAVTVDGRALPPELYPHLAAVRVEESVQLPDYFEIRFNDPHFDLFDEGRFAIGARIEIAFRAETDPIVVTSGELTAISVEQGIAGRHELVLAGMDLTHRLARAPKSRSYLNVTDADIASRIAGEYGLEVDVDGTGGTHEYVLQASETDYAFLRRRAGRIGFHFWISDKTFYFKREPRGVGTPPPLRWGQNLTRFSVRFSSSERSDAVEIRGWDALAKRAVNGQSSEAELGTDAAAGEEMAAAAQRAFGRIQRSAGHFPVADQVQAEALAQSFLLRTSGAEVVLRAEAVGDPRLGAGAMARIEQVGSRLTGSYRITSVEHLYGAGRPYITRFVCGGKEPDGLADLVGAGGGAAGGTGERRGWGHLVVGIVTNNADPERLGRVKVTFPTLSAEDESTWARVVSPGAGPRRGMQWLPEVDDEVLVGFEFDDHTRPVVLGGMWNRTDPPPLGDAVDGGAVAKRVMATRKDSRLLFIDDPTPSVDLAIPDGKCKVHLEQSESSVIGDQKLVVAATEIEIRATQKLTLNGAQVDITATGGLTLSGKPIKLN
jgi:phage protein D/phage baseplate assembly protein gpV